MQHQSRYARHRAVEAMLLACGSISNPQQSLAPRGAGYRPATRPKPRQSERDGHVAPARVLRGNRVVWVRRVGSVSVYTPSADGRMAASVVVARQTPTGSRLEFGSKRGIYFAKPQKKG